MAAIAIKYAVTMADDDDDDDEDSGSGNGGGSRRSNEEIADQVARLIQKKGGGEQGANAVALMLLNENRDLREKRRVDKTTIRDLKGKIPKEDQVVIPKTDHADFEKFKALGKPDEVKTKLEKGAALENEKTQREGDQKVIEAATHGGLQNGALLAKLARADRENFLVEVKEEQHNGQTRKVAYARANKEGSVLKPLAEFAKTDLKDYYPALIAKGDSQGSGSGSSSTGGQGTSTFTPFVDQNSASGTAQGGTKSVDDFIAKRNEAAANRPNPLAPPKPAAKS